MQFSYNIDLDFNDLLAILFRRNKRCLDCSGSVIRKTIKEDLGYGWEKEQPGLNLKINYAKRHNLKIEYICASCGKKHKPSEFW